MRYILILTVLLAFNANGQINVKRKLFSFTIPPGVEVMDYKGACVAITNNTGPDDNFRDNVNIVHQPVKDFNMDLDAYTNLNIKSFKEEGMEVTVGGEHFIGPKKVRARSVTFVHTPKGGDIELKQTQYYVKTKKEYYVITYSSTTGDYDTFYYLLESLLNTVKFK